MREIKFRFWQPFTKKMIYPKNGEGTFNDLQEKEDWKVMQYTGLKDKKRTKEFPTGQEIYEGDLIKLYSGKTWEVSFKQGRFLVPERKLCETGVIGNIYENRDLLK
mgnify:CR=1 FL=1